MKLAAIAALTVALSACKKDEKDDTTMGVLLYLLDQTSGNCAETFKVSPTQYFVVSSILPKGECNLATRFGSTLAQYISIQSAPVDRAIDAANSLNCSAATINSLTTFKNAIAATSQGVYDNDSKAVRYTPISDLRIETSAAIISTNAALNITAEDILTWTRGTKDQFTNGNAIAFARQRAFAAGDATCVAAADDKLKTDFKGFIGLDNSITTKSEITSIISALCAYGDAAPAGTECATINTRF